VVNRLSRCIGAPDGINIESAIARAEGGLALLADEAPPQIGVCLEKLSALIEQVRGASEPAMRDQAALEMCALVVDIYNIAGFFGRPQLAAAAKLMAKTVDELLRLGRPTDSVLVVFQDSLLALFRDEPARDPACDALLAELKQFSDRALL
jgi:hypothetical protein